MAETIQIMVPVYNEGDNVIAFYNNLVEAGVVFDELRFVYDMDSDTTLPFIKDLASRDSRIQPLKNTLGKGVVNALKTAFSNAKNGPLLVVMADNSDKLSIIPEMINHWRNGSIIVAPSRYMKGGKQHGGPLLKKFLSGLSGSFLGLLGFPTSDPTNNFKLYDGLWIKDQQIESDGGFEIALELTGKAYLTNKKISQLPTEWWDRSAGESNFKLWKWLPKYLKWYIPLVFITPYRNLTSLKTSK